MGDSLDVEIGKLYKDLHTAKCRIAKRKNDAHKMVEVLRDLADCFDEENEEHSIIEVGNNRFVTTRFQVNTRSGKSKYVDFPSDVGDIATDIFELEKKT